jgi:hypothetical protein
MINHAVSHHIVIDIKHTFAQMITAFYKHSMKSVTPESALTIMSYIIILTNTAMNVLHRLFQFSTITTVHEMMDMIGCDYEIENIELISLF